MGNYVGNDAQNTFTLAENGITDVAWSNDEKTIYAATADGKIKVFDVATHSLLNTWSVGKELGAISLSDDGRTLVAGGVTAGNAWAIFAIDTNLGTKTVFKPATPGIGDVEIVDNQHVLVAGNTSGHLLTLNLATGAFTPLNGGTFQSTKTVLTEDMHLTLFGEQEGYYGPLFIYDDRTGMVVAGGSDIAFPSGLFQGVQTIDETTGRLYRYSDVSGLVLYDLTTTGLKSLDISQQVQGLALDPTGRYLYAYQSGTINEYRLTDMTVVATYTAPTFSNAFGGYGNALKVSTNASFISAINYYDPLAGKGSLTLIDLTSRNEVFKGTTGADTFAGGLGNDTYTVNNAGDIIRENKFAGTDTVRSTSSYTLGAYVETLQLVGSAAINGTGNTLDNTLIGNAGVNTLDGSKGNDQLVGVGGGDTLIGGYGNDTLESGKGIDTLIGGAGNDTYVINDLDDVLQEETTGGIDTVKIAANYVLTGNLENLVLGGKAVTGIGNRLENTITGNLVANTLEGRDGNDKLFGMAGKDVLNGGDGNDMLDGGTGADMMTGGTGSDTYFVDHARDATNEIIPDAGTDIVVAAINWKLGLGLENLTLAPSIAPINGTGNDVANVIIGNATNNRLDGGLGADRMSGGLGDDTYAIDNKGDRTTEAFGAGTDTVLSSLTWKLAANVENLTLAGKAAINGTGNLLANVITGNAADNVINGGGVDDGSQRDTLIGGAGNDTYLVDPSNFFGVDIVEKAGEGTDRVVTSTYYDALPENVENMVLAGTNNISGGGNALANVITGNTGDNRLYGYDGNDTLLGGNGGDTLDGGRGDDTMKGGLGNDFYYVDSTADKVIEKAGEGPRDSVGSFITLTMPDEVEIIFLQGTANIDAFGSARNDLLIGNSGVNTLEGKDGNDYLSDVGGNDTLTGGAGADYFAIANFGFVSGGTGFTTITDFSQADQEKISLADSDANPATSEYDPFTFIGTAAFSGAIGELRYEQKDGNTFVTGDINGDMVADFTIQLTGLVTLAASDFELTL